jgi:tetratricopeptide (TPR) repeat protein
MRALLLVMSMAVACPVGCSQPPAPDPPRSSSATGDEEVTTAIDAAIKAIDASPHDAILRETLGRIYHANRMNELAIQAYDQALEFDGTRVQTWYLKANAMARLDRLEEAVGLLDHAATIDASYGPLHIRRGFWLLDLGMTKEAGDAFLAAQAVAGPTDAAHLIGLARVDLQANRPEAAVDRLRQLRRQLDHPYVRFLLGTSLRQAGQANEARALLSSATGDPPRWPDPWLEEMRVERRGLSADFDRASEAIADGALPEAQRIIQSAMAARGESPALLNKLVEILVLRGTTSTVAETLRRSIAIDPAHAPSFYNLSLHFSRQSDHQEAMKHIVEAILIQPTMAEAHLQKARIHLRTNQNDAAATAMDEAFRLGTTSLNERSMYGRTLFLVGRFADAARQQQELVLADPTRGDDWVVFIECLQEMGRHLDARRILAFALKDNPNHAVLRHMAQNDGTRP